MKLLPFENKDIPNETFEPKIKVSELREWCEEKKKKHPENVTYDAGIRDALNNILDKFCKEADITPDRMPEIDTELEEAKKRCMKTDKLARMILDIGQNPDWSEWRDLKDLAREVLEAE